MYIHIYIYIYIYREREIERYIYVCIYSVPFGASKQTTKHSPPIYFREHGKRGPQKGDSKRGIQPLQRHLIFTFRSLMSDMYPPFSESPFAER